MPSQSWQDSGVATMLLQYRRGGNRPITRRLLICWLKQLPFCRLCETPGLYSKYICFEFSIEDSIPLGLTLGYSIGHGLLHSFSCSYSACAALFFSFFLSRCPLPTRCLDKTFLNWVSSEGDACPALLGAAGFYFFDYLSKLVLS